MNLINRKNLLLFSLAAETFLGSYGLLIGKQTSIVSILYLIAGLCFIFAIMKLPPVRLPRFNEWKQEISTQAANFRVHVVSRVYYIPLLARSDSPGS